LVFRRHVLAQINAQNVQDVLQFVMSHTNGRGCDLVLSCVNVPNVEASCIVAAAHQGTILYFSMATEFGKAALGGDSIAKDVEMIIGGGVIEGCLPSLFCVFSLFISLFLFLSSSLSLSFSFSRYLSLSLSLSLSFSFCRYLSLSLSLSLSLVISLSLLS
jgi:hypothetical protein